MNEGTNFWLMREMILVQGKYLIFEKGVNFFEVPGKWLVVAIDVLIAK